MTRLSLKGRRMRGIARQADRSRYPHRPRPPQGRRHRALARLLLRRARLPADRPLRRPGAFFAAGGSITISASTPGRARAAAAASGTTGLYHSAILYPTRAALADALRRLIAARIPLDGASDHGAHEALYLRDPDENGLELYWDRPVEEWPRNTDGALDMFTKWLDIDGLLKA